MRLQIVACQLSLFAYKVVQDECAEFPGRTGDQWLRSVIAYLEFRSGEAWRPLGSVRHRHSPERLQYLDAVRLIENIRNVPAVEDQPFAALGRKSPQPIAVVRPVDGRSRGQLVDELMKANPALTNRKLLSHLQKAKLIGMLERATLRLERPA